MRNRSIKLTKVLIFFLLFFTFLSLVSCSPTKKSSELKPETDLGKSVYHKIPGYRLENFNENQDFAQSLYVNPKKHLFLTVRAEKARFNYLEKLEVEYFERNKLFLAKHLLHEGISQTDFYISYLLIFKKQGLVYEIYLRTSYGHFRPLSEIRKTAQEVALRILKS